MSNPLKDLNRGAYHPDLAGGASALRFRPRRLGAQDLRSEASCRFSFRGSDFGPVPVLDLSPTGIAVEECKGVSLAPGSLIDSLEIDYHGSTIWKGQATVVYHVGGTPSRIGLRFTSRLFNLQLLRLSDGVVDRNLDHLLDQHAHLDSLPTEWRAQVSGVRHLLLGAQELLKESESRLSDNPQLRLQDESLLFERIFARWGPRFHSLLTSLHEESKRFQDGTLSLARAYAARELLPIMFQCPVHSRAYEKPLGYAGDYRLMLLLMQRQLEGDSLFGRFLHFVTQQYSLAKSVRGREAAIRAELEALVQQGNPLRIAALACGPAIEVHRLLASSVRIQAPTEFILVDQDEEAMQFSHENLSRTLLERNGRDSHLITLNGLHLSVVQLLRPKQGSESAFIHENLSDLDFLYSAGLYDYLPRTIAQRLTRRLYSMLRPGGRLFLANLMERSDSSWMMEYVTSWFLEYRHEDSLLDLASALSPFPGLTRIRRDDTGHCFFLEVVRPT